ncbi:MAG: phosphatase PAP2 family protein [Proteobacteria bacterium]|nr:phosphatase PAP2 family protein [Cystobacterineae bacterium]MCL2258214.1 phosphatase PAP2 family protein [Cystobacterineae bacterium]MCL2315442.1 phosphatase PAP2 family protein [Pseudomonadota bacterium]
MAVIGLGLVACALVWHSRFSAWRPLLALSFAIAATDILGSQVLKPWFARIRPCFALPAESLRQLVPIADSGAMPSLHAANAFAAAFALLCFFPKTAPLGLVAASLIALSRIGAGVHWPSDVLAGAIYGACMGIFWAQVWGGRVWGRRSRGCSPRGTSV